MLIYIFFCRRWSQYLLRSAEHVCPHRDVFLLHGISDGTQISEIYLVEEVPHSLPDGKPSYSCYKYI